VSDPAAARGIPGRAGVVLAIVCSAQLILAVDITIILVAFTDRTKKCPCRCSEYAGQAS